MEWKKIRQLFPNKSRVRWAKMLADSLPTLPDIYIEILWRAMIGANIQAKLDFKPIDENFSQLASHMKVTIIYI